MAKNRRQNQKQNQISEVTVKKNEMYWCKDCQKKFEDKIGRIQVIHERKIKDFTANQHSRKLYHCSECLPDARLFNREEDLEQHVKDTHTK